MIEALIGNATSAEVIALLAVGDSTDLVGFMVFATVAIIVGLALLLLSELLGPRRKDSEKEGICYLNLS